MKNKNTKWIIQKDKSIGKGSFGEVILVECQSDKSIAVTKQVDISETSDEERKMIAKEAMILKVLSHPNIIRFWDVYRIK